MREHLRLLPERAIILFEDETDLLLFPRLGASWCRRGKSKRVVLSGFNARRVVFGALNIKSGHLLLQPQERQRAVDFQDFLDVVRSHYRRGVISMLLDEDPSHIAAESQEWAWDHDIELLWLPLRSPELNPMERLWRLAKASVCTNYQHPEIEQQTTDFMEYLLALSPDQTLISSGTASENFWLFA